MEQNTEFLTASVLARMAEESVDSVRLAIRRGRLIPAARTDGGVSLFTRLQAEAWAKTRRDKRLAPKAV